MDDTQKKKEGGKREDAPEPAPVVIDPEPESRIIPVSRSTPRLRSDRFRSLIRSEIIDIEQSGNVAGRIYETETHARELLYKFEAVRLYSMEHGTGEAFNFGRDDCRHAIHCFKWAQEWFWIREKWLKRNGARRFF